MLIARVITESSAYPAENSSSTDLFGEQHKPHTISPSPLPPIPFFSNDKDTVTTSNRYIRSQPRFFWDAERRAKRKEMEKGESEREKIGGERSRRENARESMVGQPAIPSLFRGAMHRGPS